MTKEELKEIAQHGVRTILRQMEDKIAALHAEFPEQFLSPTPPLLARPELKNGSLGPRGFYRSGPDGGVTKVSLVVPFLRTHGPARTREILAAAGMRSGGSLSTILARLRKAGEVRRVAPGLWAASDARTPTTATTKKTTKTTKRTTTKKRSPGGWSAERLATRNRSKQLLDMIDTDGPQSNAQILGHGFNINMLGPLVRRGYLKRKGDAYARTSKVFVADERKGRPGA
jgi:hypothetical protein